MSVVYGTISVAYYPKRVTLENGETFTAHDLSIRRRYQDGKEWKYVSMNMKRSEVQQLVLALEDCLRATYASNGDEDQNA